MPDTTTLPVPAQARFTALDANGLPLASGYVYTYVPNTLVPKASWQNSVETALNANPIVLDVNGSCVLYGSGSYQLVVTDSLGNLIQTYSGFTSG